LNALEVKINKDKHKFIYSCCHAQTEQPQPNARSCWGIKS